MRLLGVLAFLVLGQAGTGILRAGDTLVASGLRPARLNISGSESLLTTLNRADVIAAMRVWIDAIGKSRGYKFETRLEFAQPTLELVRRLKENSLDLLVLDTPDYLSLADAKLVEAVAVGTTRGQVGAFPYLLLTSPSSGAKQVAELRGKRIAVASRTKSDMGLVWTETLLAENRLGRAHRFFGSVDITYRAASCVLPVFFGNIDACVVDSLNWELLRELNPQLNKLRIISRSAPLLEGMIAMPLRTFPYKGDLIDAILELHKLKAGEQLTIVFKTGPLVRASREHFETVRELLGKYRRIVDPSGDLPVAPAPGSPGLVAAPAGIQTREDRR